MKKLFSICVWLVWLLPTQAQVLTPEMLWSLQRISPIGLSKDGESVLFSTSTYDIASNARSSKTYILPLSGGEPEEIDNYESLYTDPKISPNKQFQLISQEVKLLKVSGTDFYPEMDKSKVQIYESLNYRHWDQWEDGLFGHVMIKDLKDESAALLDLMQDQPFDCPQQPFGGPEDYVWNTDGTQVVYVAKKAFGTAYAISTNTDLYAYDLAKKTTTNLTADNLGYDTQPAFSKDGTLAWLQMEEPGYEADKNDLIVLQKGVKTNLTKGWDGTVDSYVWSNDGKSIYFSAPIGGTQQLFVVAIPKKGAATVNQITSGNFNVSGLVGQVKNTMVVTRTDMNHAAELYTVDLKSGSMTQLSHVNDAAYAGIKMSKVEKRMIKTTDNKAMVAWVIYPPDFDPNKKYPTILYCQGGPQSALTQFYSFRWNFQLMAANGYIIIAPNRRGMPGHGVEWNEQISGDWGGQNIQDYLSAIDDISKEPFVDTNRLGCVGASYGGYSVFYLAGIHQNRFKSFIAHDGVFNTRSMMGTTEELFFVNKDFGGLYYNNMNSKAYNEFNPLTKVSAWNTPILIIQGGRDYRVPIGQGLEAFQAAQLNSVKSKLLYFPDENHWILSPQNGIIWQKEFFGWLKETLE